MIQKTYFKTKDYCKVKFTFKPENAETVAIHGLNGDWDTSVSMTKRKDGAFICDITLPKETEHEFKYLVDQSEWVNEPEADKHAPNPFGNINSVIVL
jgi:hypothetical protein